MSSRKKVAVSSFVQSGNFEISSQAGFGHVEHTVIPQYGDNVITWIGKPSCVHVTSLQKRADFCTFCFYD